MQIIPQLCQKLDNIKPDYSVFLKTKGCLNKY